MRFASLGSGSSGNATVVSAGDAHILIDCGFSLREAEKRLRRLGLQMAQISAVLVTHEHSDHCKGVPSLCSRYPIPVYMTTGTGRRLPRAAEIVDLRLIDPHDSFHVGSIRVTAVPVPHDAAQPVQYIFEHADNKLGVLTDLGHAAPAVVEAFQSCSGLLLESNYDEQMLAAGPYPYFLKARISGRRGHLSNQQAAGLLDLLDTSRLKHLVIGHLSQKNNTVELAKQALAQVQRPLGKVHYACQEGGCNWISLL